ncbi:MAG: carboxypeptidase regulatory-like domain-containing protein [bacterium]
MILTFAKRVCQEKTLSRSKQNRLCIPPGLFAASLRMVFLLAGLLFWVEPVSPQTLQNQLRHLSISPAPVNAGLLSSKSNLDADIVLRKVRRGMFLDGDEGDERRVEWEPPIPCFLRYDTKPGNRDLENNYPHTITATGAGSLLLNPFKEGMRTGVYYCILVSQDDPDRSSVEFKVIVEASSSARMIKPSGATILQQGTPVFEWDVVEGVPYYLIFLSEGQIRIQRNDEGKITGVTGLNLTWQAITAESFLKYGDLDPGGNFLNAHVPPLFEDIKYNWIILNSYSPNPDFISSRIAPVAPAEFTVQRPTLDAGPVLIEPANDIIVADEEMVFSWSPVAEATRYRLFLYETAEFSSSTIRFTMWSQVTSDTEIRLKARNFLVNTDYAWRVVAENGDRISTGELRPFRYDGAAGWAKFSVHSAEGPLPSVSIKITNEANASTLLPVLTDTFGVKKVALPAGNYGFTASRPGFQTTQRALFTVPSHDTAKIAVEIQRGATSISGRVVDPAGNGLFNAGVELRSSGGDESVASDDNGYFSFAVAPGGYDLRARKRDFVTSPWVSFSLANEEALNIGTIPLSPATNGVNGQVVFAEDSKPLQGAFVRAQKDDVTYETTTNNQGGFRFRLGPGTWRITLNSQGFVATPPEYTVELTNNDQRSAPFQLSSGSLLYGTISFQNRGFEGVEVQAFEQSTGQLVQTTLSNVQGNYSLGLPEGEFEVVVSRQNFLPIKHEISLTAGQTLVQDFVLTEAGFVKGRVFNAETLSPVAGARVFVLEDTTLFTFTDGDGSYSLGLQPNIPFQLDVFLPGFGSDGPLNVTTLSGEVVTGRDFLLTALSGIIRGQVTDGVQPLPGATVRIATLDREVLTDQDGRFQFEIPPGTYEIQVSKECHLSTTRRVELEAGVTLDLAITLRPLQSVITGAVIDNLGEPVAQAEITATGDTAVFKTRSDSGGLYELCLDRGIFRVVASKLGYFPADTALVVNEGDLHTGVNFILRESFATVSGTVRDTLDFPVPSAVVHLNQPAQQLRDTTDNEGRYVLTRVIPGLAQVRAFKDNFYGLTQTVVLQAQQQASLDLTLFPSDGLLTGIARDSHDSTGIEGVTIEALFSESNDEVFRTRTNASGAFALTGLPVVPNASFTVLAFKDGFLSPPTPLTNVAVNSTGLEFYLVNLNGIIAGVVRDVDTVEPVSGVRVEAVITDGGSRSVAVTDDGGRFEITRLAPARRYTLKTSRDGYFPQTLEDRAPGDTSVVILISRKYGFVKGRIIDLKNGRGFSNVAVIATPGPDGRQAETVSDRNGEYIIRLVPDFYNIQPVLSHHRSEPEQLQVEVAEIDTLANIDFGLARQTVNAITVQRADLELRPSISNLETHCYEAEARDSDGLLVDIGEPVWRLNVSKQAATIDADGCVTLAATYFGDLTITAKDPVSGVKGALQVKVFAPIDSTSDMVLFDDRGLQVQIFPNSVPGKRDLQVTRQPLAPAKKGRAQYLTTDYSYTLKPRGLSFDPPVRLMLPPPENTEGQERHLAKWDDVKNEWFLLASDDNAGLIRANIFETGEYVALAISKPLTIENFTLLPNPFSPHQQIDGMMGLKIAFDITSNVAPTPLLTVKIYNLEGNLVRLLHDQTPFQRGRTIVHWDGKTDNGLLARNGRYLVRVVLEDPADKRDKMKSVVLIK